MAKWRLLVNAAGGGLSFRTAARAYYMGLFGNTFLPSIVGGDVVRAGVALRAAKYPHMPCTPPPGGVDAEQMKRRGFGVE